MVSSTGQLVEAVQWRFLSGIALGKRFDQSWCFVKTGRQAVGLFGWIFVGVLKSRVRDFCVPTCSITVRVCACNASRSNFEPFDFVNLTNTIICGG